MDLQGIKLTWLGHACFKLETPAGHTVILDPWVSSNPSTPADMKKFESVDALLCSHGHFDHIGDAIELAKKHDATVVAMFELCNWMEKKGVKKISPMGLGGSQMVLDMKINMVQAFHSSGIQDGEQTIYGGTAAGYVVQFENGLKIYHAGDTAVFGDMRLIHELYHPDIAMLPIGDRFTMGPREAAYACELLRPKTVVPMHYGTFPLLTGTVAEFKKQAADVGVEIIEMYPGQTLG